MFQQAAEHGPVFLGAAGIERRVVMRGFNAGEGKPIVGSLFDAGNIHLDDLCAQALQ